MALPSMYVYGIIAIILFGLTAITIGFLDGPGIFRDIIPSFNNEEIERVEWNQNFHIEDPQYVVIVINPDDAFDNDNHNYRYGPDSTLPDENLNVGGFDLITDQKFSKGDSWEYRGQNLKGAILWDRLEFDPVITEYSAAQNSLLTVLKNMGFENGLQQILVHFVQNRDDYAFITRVDLEIYVGNFDRPLLKYKADDPKLKDVDFIIETINRGTRGYKKSRGIE